MICILKYKIKGRVVKMYNASHNRCKLTARTQVNSRSHTSLMRSVFFFVVLRLKMYSKLIEIALYIVFSLFKY